MKSNMVIVVAVVVQIIMSACLPVNSQAAVLDRSQDPEQLWNIGWELSQGCLKHRDALRVKDNRQAHVLRNRGRIFAKLQQPDLLQELLPPKNILQELLE